MKARVGYAFSTRNNPTEFETKIARFATRIRISRKVADFEKFLLVDVVVTVRDNNNNKSMSTFLTHLHVISYYKYVYVY